MNTLPSILSLVLVTLWVFGCAVPNQRVDPSAPPAVTAGAASATPYVWSRSMEAKRVTLERSTRDTGIAVLRTRDNQLQINVPSDFSFDTDSAAIKPDMRPVLDQVAEDLEVAEMSRMLILVTGHTDSRGADAANDSLSLARAVNVRKYLESTGNVANRVTIPLASQQPQPQRLLFVFTAVDLTEDATPELRARLRVGERGSWRAARALCRLAGSCNHLDGGAMVILAALPAADTDTPRLH